MGFSIHSSADVSVFFSKGCLPFSADRLEWNKFARVRDSQSRIDLKELWWKEKGDGFFARSFFGDPSGLFQARRI